MYVKKTTNDKNNIKYFYENHFSAQLIMISYDHTNMNCFIVLFKIFNSDY